MAQTGKIGKIPTNVLKKSAILFLIPHYFFELKNFYMTKKSIYALNGDLENLSK